MSALDPRIVEAQERLATLARARAFRDLVESAGWKELYRLRESWLNKGREEVRRIPTDNAQAALDCLRRWQLAEDLMELEVRFINETLAEAEEIPGALNLDDALLMEQLNHEQSESTGRSDRTGH